MNKLNQLRFNHIIKKFDELDAEAGIQYIDEHKKTILSLHDGQHELAGGLHKIFTHQIAKFIKQYDGPLPMRALSASQDAQLARLIKLFALELVSFKDINLLTTYLSLFWITKPQSWLISHFMIGCINNDGDLNAVLKFLPENQHEQYRVDLERHFQSQRLIDEMKEQRQATARLFATKTQRTDNAGHNKVMRYRA